MKKLLATVLTLSALAAGCTSGDDDTTTATETTTASTETGGTDSVETTTTGADVTTTAAAGESDGSTSTTAVLDLEGPAPGVTDDTIRIGVIYVDLETVSTVTTNHGDYELAYQSIIDDINANGGINGRTIEATYFPINPAEESSSDTACVTLTEDEPVFVAMGFFLGEAVACYLELHQTAVIGGSMTDDLLARAQAPWFTGDVGGDSFSDAVHALVDAGELDGTVGVYAAADDQGLVDSIVLPILEEAGIEPAEVAYNDADPADEVAGNAAVDAINQRFESSGVDTVLAVNNGSYSYASGLERTGYRPRLVMTDNRAIQTYYLDANERDLSVLEGSVVMGTFGPPQALVDLPMNQECIDLYIAGGGEWVDPVDWVEGPKPWVSTTTACRMLHLFEAIATAAGPNLNYATFQQAGENLGEIDSPLAPDPVFYGAPPHADGDQPVYVFRWDADERDYIIEN